MALSYHNGSAESLIYATYWDVLDKHCDEFPNKEALIMYEKDKCFYRSTFRELRDRSWSVAVNLLSRFPDLEQGDHVGIIGSNRPELFLAELAAHRLGLCAVYLPNSLKDGLDLITAINMTNCKGLIFENDFVKPDVINVIFTEIPTLKFGILFGDNISDSYKKNVYTWGTISNQQYTESDLENAKTTSKLVQPEMDAVAYFTSGSTGFPKAVIHTHFGIVNNQVIFGELSNWDNNTIFLQDRAMSSHGGSVFSSRLVGISGGTSVTVKPKNTVKASDPSDIYKIVEKERVNQILMFGYMMYDFITSPAVIGNKLSTLQSATLNGQLINMEHAELLHKILPHIKLMNVYGTTEMNAVVVQESNTTPGFNGKLVGHMEAKVVDENGKTVLLGQPGELCIRSPTILRCYITKDGEKTGKDPSGWHHTNDNAIMNEKGEIKILGRMSDVIKRAGQLIFPSLIEKVITDNTKVQEVQVVGVSDKRLFQDICACVVKKDSSLTEEEMRMWCKTKFNKDQTDYSIEPSYYLFLSEFPRLVSGKIDRRKLRGIAEENIVRKQVI